MIRLQNILEQIKSIDFPDDDLINKPGSGRNIQTEFPNKYSEYGTNIVSIANKFQGGGYAWQDGSSGVCVPLEDYDGNLIKNCSANPTSHCCGFTLSVAWIAASNRGLFKKKSAAQLEQFATDWYGAGGAPCGKLCVAALENLGIGYEVDLESAAPGDFCQIWRTNGSGHSVIFLSHIKDDNNNIIGIKYRSSQPSTDGIGEPAAGEKFSDTGGRMNRECTWFGRMNLI